MNVDKVQASRHVPFTRPLHPPSPLTSPRSMCLPLVCVPSWLLFSLILFILATPAAAQTDYTCGCKIPVSAAVAALLLAGHYVVAVSGALIGPLMGISSVLWLVMRNDAAIAPKSSWM